MKTGLLVVEMRVCKVRRGEWCKQVKGKGNDGSFKVENAVTFVGKQNGNERITQQLSSGAKSFHCY